MHMQVLGGELLIIDSISQMLLNIENSTKEKSKQMDTCPRLMKVNGESYKPMT